MAKNCSKCKFNDSDFEWNDDINEEFEIQFCQKRRKEFTDDKVDCECFKKFRQRKYVEKDTKCDSCSYKNECDLIEITTSYDLKRHFIIGMGNVCKKRV